MHPRLRPALRGWKLPNLRFVAACNPGLRPALRGWKLLPLVSTTTNPVKSPTRLEGMETLDEGVRWWERA